MEQIKALLDWWNANGGAIAAIILGLIPIAETIVRLTPTQKDDGAVERLGKRIRRVFDVLGLPKNRAANGGEHPNLIDKPGEK